MPEEQDSDQRRMNKRVSAALKSMQAEQQKRDVMKQLLDTKAYERLMNIRIANHDLYDQVINVVVSLAQSGRLQGKMSETQLLSVLSKITVRKETSIDFKHK
ncbi:MAG TPA: DNA-binding protein [Candidatus Acidoferrum sp.]|nr:DNA-binding protein [Candidatus Acidoferrum sp.]